jgi:hypothetical protein
MGKGDDWMTTVIECVEGYYEVEHTSYGRAYIWRPEHVVVECDCGERVVLSASETVCSCGVDHVALVREELVSQKVSDEAPHPWEAEYQEWRRKNAYLFSEEIYQLELTADNSDEG